MRSLAWLLARPRFDRYVCGFVESERLHSKAERREVLDVFSSIRSRYTLCALSQKNVARKRVDMQRVCTEYGVVVSRSRGGE